MNIAFCINDAYAPYVAVTLKSIVENNSSIALNVYILTDGISDKNRCALENILQNRGGERSSIHIYNVDDSKLKGLKDTWSIYAWYRILLPEVLPCEVKNILYLDADIVIDSDISHLFGVNMEGKSVAGVIDIQSFKPETYERCLYGAEKKYICTGVLMINLEYWREHNICESIINWARKNEAQIHFPDQDAINHVCQDTKIVLDLRYGILDIFFHRDYFYEPPYRQQLKEAINHPAIIHYAGQSPWVYEQCFHLMQDRWDYYNSLLCKPVKKCHKPQGYHLVTYYIKRILDRMGVISFRPWYVSDKILIKDIQKRLEDR